MMSKLISALRSKVRSVRGESITEVLVSIVISGLAILMLATVIATAMNVNKSSREAMNNYYEANNNVVSNATTVTGTVTVSPAAGGSAIAIASSDSVGVECRVGEQSEGVIIASYTEGSGVTG